MGKITKRDLEDKFKNEFSYSAKLDVGLVGDGSTNDAINLNTWITSIGSTKVDLYFSSGIHKLATNITIPSNVRLVFTNGAILKRTNSAVITLNCGIDAGLHQIFDDDGTGSWAGRPKISKVHPEWFGAVGDAVTDDNAALQKCLTNARTFKTKIEFTKMHKSVGTLITEDVNDSASSLHITGVGLLASNATLFDSPTCGITFYNLVAKECGFQGIGRGTGGATAIKLEDIALICDETTCDGLSFCMLWGDARNSSLTNVHMHGYNNLMIRCGTNVLYDVNYLISGCKVTNCTFSTTNYYSRYTTNIKPKALYGFCVAPEELFVSKTHYPWDTIVFDSCQFYGSVYTYGTLVTLINPIFEITGCYRPLIAEGTDSNINWDFIKADVDGTIALVCLSGNNELINPYFETCMRCICSKKSINYSEDPSAKDVRINIKGGIFQPDLNFSSPPVVEGVTLEPKYAIKLEGTEGSEYPTVLNVEHTTFYRYEEWTDGTIINEIGIDISVDITKTRSDSANETMIVDNISKRRRLNFYQQSFENKKTIKFKHLMKYTDLLTNTIIEDGATTDFNFYKLPYGAVLSHVRVIVPNFETLVPGCNFDATTYVNVVHPTALITNLQAVTVDRAQQRVKLDTASIKKQTTSNWYIYDIPNFGTAGNIGVTYHPWFVDKDDYVGACLAYTDEAIRTYITNNTVYAYIEVTLET